MEASDSSDTVQTARMIVTIVQLTSGNVHSLRYELSCKQRCRFLKADFPPIALIDLLHSGRTVVHIRILSENSFGRLSNNRVFVNIYLQTRVPQ